MGESISLPPNLFYMKQLFFLFLLTVSISSYSQDTTKVEQYAEVVATQRLLSNKVAINVDYGEERKFWKDNRVKDDEGRVKKFNTIVDALNYMGRQNWRLVSTFLVTSANNTLPLEYHYLFKREFLKSETE